MKIGRNELARAVAERNTKNAASIMIIHVS